MCVRAPILGGIRTRNPRIRSPMRYPLRQWGIILVKSTFGGARTRDHRIKSPALYHLSYEGTLLDAIRYQFKELYPGWCSW